MADEDGTITVCIGNYGYYNEGELRDQWITLPKSDEEIRAFLRDNGLYDSLHEETYISDYDGIPLGMAYGGAFSELTSLDDLNLLARAMSEAEPWELEQVRHAFECGADQPTTVIGVANLVAQAGDIPFSEFAWKPSDPNNMVSSPEEAYALTEIENLGGPEYLPREELERHFDVERYGRDMRIDSVQAGDEGWCWRGSMEGPDASRYGTVAEAFEEAGWDAGDLDTRVDATEPGEGHDLRPISELTPAEVRHLLAREVGYSPKPEDPVPAGVAADERMCLLLADGLDDFRREAVSTYLDAQVGYPNAPSELASVIAAADEIDYREYSSRAADIDVRVGETLVEEYYIDESELANYFDYEGYGREAAQEGVLLSDEGYLWGDMPKDDAYSREELEEMYPEPAAAGHDDEVARAGREAHGERDVATSCGARSHEVASVATLASQAASDMTKGTTERASTGPAR